LVVELSELTAPRWGLLGWKLGDTTPQGVWSVVER